MCCKIDLNNQKDARHFLGKDCAKNTEKTVRLWDKIIARFKKGSVCAK